MTGDPCLDIADSVAAILNAKYASTLGNVFRVILDPEIETEATETLQADIVPGSIASEIGTRETQRGEYQVHIGLRQKIDPTNRTDINALFLILHDIDSFLFETQRACTDHSAAWFKSYRYPFSTKEMRARKFFGMVTVTYVVYD